MKLRDIIGVAAGGALLGAALFAGGAGAAPADTTGTANTTMHIVLPLNDLEITLDLTVDLPDGTFDGTVDDETGAVTGTITHAPGTYSASTPDGPAPIDGSASIDDITGTVDGDGDFTGTGQMTFVINTVDLGGATSPIWEPVRSRPTSWT